MPQLSITLPAIGQKPWGADLNADLNAMIAAINVLNALVESGRLSSTTLANAFLAKVDQSVFNNLASRVSALEAGGGGGGTPSPTLTTFGTAPFGTAPFGGLG